jgi:uncharacterized protein YidB (DUF937 family)
MGLLDSVIGALNSQGGGASGGGGTQAALLQAVIGMLLQGGQPAGGAAGGLGGLLEQFKSAGLGDAAQSWIGTGPNKGVSADQISQVFGGDVIGQLASRLGLAPTEVSGQLSEMLPDVVDRLTPGGQLPQGNDLAALGNIDGILGSLMRR